jgi:hypothetical protein
LLFITGFILSSLSDNIGFSSFLFFGLIFLTIGLFNMNKWKVKN